MSLMGRLGRLAENSLRKIRAAGGHHAAREEEKPGLSQYETFGRNIGSEVAEVVLNLPERHIRRVIVNSKGYFECFPGIEQGPWTARLEGKFDFDQGAVHYRTVFEKKGDGYRCLWEIQPDGRYWADSDGFGMENDDELILYADLDAEGVFTGPFRIYSICGRRVEQSE